MTGAPEPQGQSAPPPDDRMIYGDEVLNAGWTTIPGTEAVGGGSKDPLRSDDLPSDAEIADFLTRLYANQA